MYFRILFGFFPGRFLLLQSFFDSFTIFLPTVLLPTAHPLRYSFFSISPGLFSSPPWNSKHAFSSQYPILFPSSSKHSFSVILFFYGSILFMALFSSNGSALFLWFCSLFMALFSFMICPRYFLFANQHSGFVSPISVSSFSGNFFGSHSSISFTSSNFSAIFHISLQITSASSSLPSASPNSANTRLLEHTPGFST